MFELWRAQRAKRRTDRKFSLWLRKAIMNKEPQIEIESLRDQWSSESDVSDLWIESVKSNRLLRDANKLDIPVPAYLDKEKWLFIIDPSRRSLTREARYELWQEILKEKLRRSELRREWFKVVGPIIAALTGLIGTIIGLLAFLQK